MKSAAAFYLVMATAQPTEPVERREDPSGPMCMLEDEPLECAPPEDKEPAPSESSSSSW